tara:strand:- start:660 stop:1196 length:537 start_codon:yes stop_codon:yes gene_type:complete
MSYRFLKFIKDRNSKIQTVNHANLNILDEQIELDINGVPLYIMIQYTGSVYFNQGNFNGDFIANKNNIILMNKEKNEIGKQILEYSGNLRIINCQIMNFNGTSIKATVNNKHQAMRLNLSVTNFEDDTLILYDDRELEVGGSRGFSGGRASARSKTSRTAPSRTVSPRPSGTRRRGGY